MTALTQPDASNIAALIARYDVGEPRKLGPADAGGARYYCETEVDGKRRQWLLSRVDDDAEEWLTVAEACDHAGLPVARPLPTRDGGWFETFAGADWMMSSRLPGRHVSNPTFRQCNALGRFLARFHLAALRSDEVRALPLDVDWLYASHAQAAPGLSYLDSRLIGDTIDCVAAMLRRSDVRGLPAGPLHTGLFRHNVLFTERGLTGALDLQHTAAGYHVFDMAVVINDWCCDTQGVLDPDRTMALLHAYHSVRKLRREEAWFLPVFALYTGVCHWLARLAERSGEDRAGSALPSKHIDELRRLVEQRHGHFFYIDTRLL